MHLPSPDLIDQRIRIQQCFYQTEASYGKQSQLLSAPAQITISTQAPQLEASKQWADALPSQSTSPILCLALSVSEPVFLACPLSLLLESVGWFRIYPVLSLSTQHCGFTLGGDRSSERQPSIKLRSEQQGELAGSRQERVFLEAGLATEKAQGENPT